MMLLFGEASWDPLNITLVVVVIGSRNKLRHIHHQKADSASKQTITRSNEIQDKTQTQTPTTHTKISMK